MTVTRLFPAARRAIVMAGSTPSVMKVKDSRGDHLSESRSAPQVLDRVDGAPELIGRESVQRHRHIQQN